MFPSHTTMYIAPVTDEEERKLNSNEYAAAMSDWHEFEQTTNTMYGVDMSILMDDFEKEQKDYYLLSSRWRELAPEVVLTEPQMVKHFDMMTCTIHDARGISPGEENALFDFDVIGTEVCGPISGFACWFTADFRSRTDSNAVNAPRLSHPAFLSTGPESGYTHWGQQVFYFLSNIPVMKDEAIRIDGSIELTRTKENSRLYNCRFNYHTSRRKIEQGKDGQVLVKSKIVQTYQIP